MDKSKTAEKPREFFKVNIHEERTAAYVARSMPFLVFLVTVCVLTLGVLRNTVLLLTVTAALNVAMWLWVVSMGITCIYGVYRAQETIEHAEKAKMQEKPGPKSDAAQDPEKIDKEPEPEEASPKKAPVSHVVEEKVRHIVVIPNYKEPENLLDDTLQSLSEVTGSKDLWVILAMEAREKEAEAKAKNLEAKYTCFAKIMSHFHPENLEEIHLDGSREAEVKGKASNLKSAVKKVCEEVDKETTDEEKGSKTVQLTSRPTDVLTVIDADVILHPMYFAHISREFVARKENGDDPSYTFWQAPQLPWRNFYTCPVVSRVWGYISSLWEFGGVAGLMYGSHHMVFSAYTVPLELAREAECWDGDVIAEDHHWGQRGRVPEMETAQHTVDGEVPEVDRGQLLMLRHLTRLLLVSKESTPTDAQRLLRQAMPGAELVLAEMSSVPAIPSFFLVCSREMKVAYLVMPGTRKLSDLVTDFNATEEAFGDGFGHRGMVEAARWMHEQVGPALIRLYTSGYRITLLGHSLGAGVGALLTLILRPHISSLCCYGFGTPACVDENLMPQLLNCMVSVVNRDDLVPRLSVNSVQGLLESVLCPGQVAKTQAWMKEDWQAVKDFERIIELRRRGQKEAEGDSSASPSNDVIEDESMKLMMLMEAGVDRTRALRALRSEHGDLNSAMLRATAEMETSEAAEAEVPTAPPPAPIQRLGGFFQEMSQQAQHMTQLGASRLQGIHLGPRPPDDPDSAPSAPPPPAPPVPRPPQMQLLIPGEVIHLYRRNGLARAAKCAANHETFTRIIPSQEMLKDHQMESYALAIHQACLQEPPVPEWESFDMRELCACCNSDFTWAYVLQSEPQKMLSRHHCFSCGRVVCEGCSRKRLSHERLGFQMPVRTCDSCAFAQFEGAQDAVSAFAAEEAAARSAAAGRG